jgi:CheY-like chemotaxis protein
MSGREEPLGAILSAVGALSRLELAELVEMQRSSMPLGSLCYVLGLVDEETVARALASQLGVAAVVLDRSVIALEVLDGAAPELALENRILPLAEDRSRLLVACERPAAVADVLRELEFIKGKRVVPHVALKVTLERTLRACLRAHARGLAVLAGPSVADPAVVGMRGIFVVPESSRAEGSVATPVPVAGAADEDLLLGTGEDTEIESSQELLQAVLADVAGFDDGVGTETEPTAPPARPPRDGAAAQVLDDSESGRLPLVSPDTAVAQMARRGGGDGIEVLDLDGRDGVEYRPFRGPPGRVLVVDDDFASRQLLAKELGAAGYDVQTASHGGEAVARITGHPPDVIVVDIMLPEIDGFRICRAVKQSSKYGGIAVVLISAVIDSGRVTDEVLNRYGADAYFEKPIQVEPLRERLQALLAARAAANGRSQQDSFERAMSLYRAGDIDAAVGELRLGIEENPASARHHFVLANILHKKSLIIEAIDEYEATLEIRPDYFPALTRLAYLYYRQGYAARAIDTWRRSLPLCADPALRHNIEQFMRKLIGEVGEL